MASRRKARAYRIVSPRYPLFDGTGTHRWGSRWVSPGSWVVHGAETYALAVLENLVHWQTSALPPNLVCVEVEIPASVKQERLDAVDAPALLSNDYGSNDPGSNDPGSNDYMECRKFGDAWYERAETAVLWVPSVVSPYESNVLFNQQHKDFKRIAVGEATPAHLDPRFWSNARPAK